MDSVTEISIYLIQYLFGFYAALALLRFLLQLSQANFYNPVSQFIVKATEPVLSPLRKLLPPFKNIDSASLLLSIAVLVGAIELTVFIAGLGFIPPLNALAWAAIGIFSMLLNIYFFGLFAAIIISWVMPYNQHPAIALIWQLLDPVMAPLRKILPALGGIDLSPIVIFLLINVLQIVVRNLAIYAQLLPNVVPGI